MSNATKRWPLADAEHIAVGSEQLGAIAGPVMQAPIREELRAFVHSLEPWATWLKPGSLIEDIDRDLVDLMMAALQRFGRPAFHPIPVSERLPGPDDCCPNPRNGQGQWCWGWVQHDPILYGGRWRMMCREWLLDEALAWAPWWAFPIPGNHSPDATKMAGENHTPQS
jgi:hypothetical protein